MRGGCADKRDMRSVAFPVHCGSFTSSERSVIHPLWSPPVQLAGFIHVAIASAGLLQPDSTVIRREASKETLLPVATTYRGQRALGSPEDQGGPD